MNPECIVFINTATINIKIKNKLPMNDLIQYLTIPNIPNELIEPIEDIIKKPIDPESKIPSSYKYFQTKKVDKKLEDYLRNIFNKECHVRYQIIMPKIQIHKDVGRNLAINYLLDTGGDAYTCFYCNNKKIILYEKIPLKTWHQLKVNVFHNVINQTSTRIAISVTP